MTISILKQPAFEKTSKEIIGNAFKGVLNDFYTFYGLYIYILKQIDQYFWQLGKKHFKKTMVRDRYTFQLCILTCFLKHRN